MSKKTRRQVNGTLVAGLMLAAGCSLALGGAVKTATIQLFPELPVTDNFQSLALDPSLVYPDLRSATILTTRVRLQFTPLNGYNANNIRVALVSPIDNPSFGVLEVLGSTYNWTGPGPFVLEIETDALNGLMPPPGVPRPWFLDISNIDGDPPIYSGQWSIDSRFEIDYDPVLVFTTACQPADIADDMGMPHSTTNPNNGVNEGDYNLFFAADGFFEQASMGSMGIGMFCDIADDAGTALPPFDQGGTNGTENNGVNEGDYNCFFNNFFLGCPV
ncbi:MAG: hypothetical protein IBJ18_12665 [Phycisphaerales bacterium]|nr:hypothetical protein [Phycisphaerales bacterium]